MFVITDHAQQHGVAQLSDIDSVHGNVVAYQRVLMLPHQALSLLIVADCAEVVKRTLDGTTQLTGEDLMGWSKSLPGII